MKRFFSLLLICGILGQAAVRTLWAIDYQIKRADYLLKCENKDKPSMHCDGKCYLRKQMGIGKTDNTKGPQLPESFREIKDLQLFVEPLLALPTGHFELEMRHFLPLFQFHCSDGFLAGVFRPPSYS